jgi:diaminohydroxyphosphoribosylaminopyrimidine deaminase/5-amino-6-(5-phosphoribosylamino)uracil reductase
MVGAVVVNEGEIVGLGYHERYGSDHAETIALRSAGEKARGSTLYVSLEPCCHTGHTPPCTRAIIEAGVRGVVVGEVDPNPAANGKGIQTLRESGIDVTVGILPESVRKLNRSYFKSREKGSPWIRLKLAMTLDGKIADADGESRWISCGTSRQIVHRWRGESDAVMVGIGTVLSDDPSLLPRDEFRRLPARVIVDSNQTLPSSARLIGETARSRVIVASLGSGSSERAETLKGHGVEVWTLPDKRGRVDVGILLERLHSEGIITILCEGGARLAGSLIEGGLVDRISLFVAPKLLGPSGKSAFGGLGDRSMNTIMEFSGMEAHQSGDDLLIEVPLSEYN